MLREHRRSVWPILLAVLQVFCWVSATSRSFPSAAQGPIAHSTRTRAGWESEQGVQTEVAERIRATAFKRLTSLGSRPPNCNHKCGGCVPCDAIQVPATTDHLGLQYANYEPEGWKCKCGTYFYNP